MAKSSRPGSPRQLTKYWTRGPGALKWTLNPHPYTALTTHLRMAGVPGRMVNGLAAKYFKAVFGIWPGQRKRNK